jgi:hypothetical protein
MDIICQPRFHSHIRKSPNRRILWNWHFEFLRDIQGPIQ